MRGISYLRISEVFSELSQSDSINLFTFCNKSKRASLRVFNIFDFTFYYLEKLFLYATCIVDAPETKL